MPIKNAVINWSGGKDSALALYRLRQSGKYELHRLLTSVSEKYQRISMHGVRVDLLDKQAEAIGLPLVKMEVPDMPSMEIYERTMRKTLESIKAEGVSVSVFGDIFLEDLRAYREDKLSEIGLEADFPLWKIPTHQLIREFLDLGFQTIVTCVNEKYLDRSFAGRVIDDSFLADLPAGVDPCGENGEFHTFVFDGPIFSKPVSFSIGETVYRTYTPQPKEKDDAFECGDKESEQQNPFDTGFWYCDLIPQT